jgi:hypothetical protein
VKVRDGDGAMQLRTAKSRSSSDVRWKRRRQSLKRIARLQTIDNDIAGVCGVVGARGV